MPAVFQHADHPNDNVNTDLTTENEGVETYICDANYTESEEDAGQFVRPTSSNN